MDIKLETKPIADVEVDAVVVMGCEGDEASAGGDAAKELYSSGEFTGKALEVAILHRPSGMKARRLVLAGGGKREKFDSAALRRVTGAALRTLKGKGVRSIVLALDEPFRSDDFTAAAVEGALLGNFETNTHKTDPKKDEKQVDWFAVLGGTQSGVDRGRILGESQNFCRSLAEEPGNVMTPTLLSEKARAMAAEQGLECEILNEARMRELGMGALLGVSQGSDEPPAMIIIRYRPAGAPSSQEHLGLVEVR